MREELEKEKALRIIFCGALVIFPLIFFEIILANIIIILYLCPKFKKEYGTADRYSLDLLKQLDESLAKLSQDPNYKQV